MSVIREPGLEPVACPHPEPGPPHVPNPWQPAFERVRWAPWRWRVVTRCELCGEVRRARRG